MTLLHRTSWLYLAAYLYVRFHHIAFLLRLLLILRLTSKDSLYIYGNDMVISVCIHRGGSTTLFLGYESPAIAVYLQFEI